MFYQVTFLEIFLKILGLWDFGGGPVVKNLPCCAGDVGSIPGQGTKIPHDLGQLRPCATSYWNLSALQLILCNERSYHN